MTLISKALVFILMSTLWPGSSGVHAQDRQLKAPAAVASDPLLIKQGERGTLHIHVTAIDPLDRLDVSIRANTGVELDQVVPEATFANLKRGERHDFEVAVRLTSTDFGYVVVAVKTTSAGEVHSDNRTLIVGAMPPPAPRVPVGSEEDLADLTLMKVSGGNAVVRFGSKPFVVVKVGDRLGRNKAELIEVSDGRIVLDETFIDADGKPNRARVTIKEGEKGGTRVLVRPGEAPPATSRVTVLPKPPGNEKD